MSQSKQKKITVSDLTPDQWQSLTREQQAVVVYKMRGLGYSRAEMAAMAGATTRSIRSRLDDSRALELAGKLPTDLVDVTINRKEIVDTEMDRRDRLAINREARSEITREYVTQGLLNQIQTNLANHSKEQEQMIAKFKRETIEAVKRLGKSAKGIEAAIHHVSDLHHCRYIPGVMDESTTAGALNRYLEHTTRLLVRQRAHANVDTCFVFINGDNIHGVANYKSQAREVSGTMSYQIYTTAVLFIDYINKLRTQFSKVVVIVTGGNHGRKAKDDDLLTENSEFEMGRMIQFYFANCDDVEVKVAFGNFYHVENVLGRPIMVTHGDKVDGSGDPKTIIDAVKRWQLLSVIPKFNDVFMGHWHRQMMLPIVGGKIYVGGTAAFEDSYLITKGSEPVLQYQFVFCNGRRITAHYDIDLYDPTP